MPSLRHQRVRQLLKREIGEVIRREIPAGDVGLITVNDVGVAGDLQSATVFVGIIGTAEQQRKGVELLKKERLRIQDLVGRAVVLKYAPRLRFVLDDSVVRGNRVLEIGDCVGSQLGLALALQGQGKKVVCWNEDRLPQKLAFLDARNLMEPPSPGHRFDCVIAADSASFERLGKVGKCVQNRKLLLNIDHHASNTRYGDVNWVSARESSTGELIFRLLSVAGWPITPPIADCLFTAVSTDNFRLTHNDQIAWFKLKKADFARTGADTADAEGLIDHIRAIEPVVVACVFEELDPELTRVSLRSKSERINVSDIASRFGGGGHQAAAGARVPGKPLAVQRRVIAAITKALDAAG